MIKGTPNWLYGCTNFIITQHQGIDLLVNVRQSFIHSYTPEVGDSFRWTLVFLNFRNQTLERSDDFANRKWMDTIVTDVNESWGEKKVSTRPKGAHQCVISYQIHLLKK